MNVATEFLSSAVKRFNEYKALGDKTFAQLNDDEIRRQPNDASNSIAVIVQHMHGNMRSRWTAFLTEDGEKPWRQRDEEFEPHELSKREVAALWEQGWGILFDALHSLTEDDLLKQVTIRSQPLIVMDAVNRQLAHYSYHVGQIVYLGRWFKNSEWKSLSIPKGGSQKFTDELRKA